MVQKCIPINVLSKAYIKNHKVEKQWCNCCDCNEVDPNDESSGTFFIQHGYVEGSDDWVGIIWAICTGCLA